MYVEEINNIYTVYTVHMKYRTDYIWNELISILPTTGHMEMFSCENCLSQS